VQAVNFLQIVCQYSHKTVKSHCFRLFSAQGREGAIFAKSFVFFGRSKGFRLRKPLLEQNMRGCVLAACGKHTTTPMKKNEKTKLQKS
jgi:hypothetical protein